MLRIFSNVCWLSVCLPGKMSIQILCSFLTGLSGFSNSHLCTWELDHKEGWVSNKLYFQIVVLEKTLDNPLDCKKIQPVNLKGNQPRIFIGRTDAEAETPILWTPVAKSRLTGKDPDAEQLKAEEEAGGRDEIDSFMDSMDMDLSKLRKIVENRGAWHAAVLQRVGHNSVNSNNMLFWSWVVWVLCIFFILNPYGVYHFQISYSVDSLFILLTVSFAVQSFLVWCSLICLFFIFFPLP